MGWLALYHIIILIWSFSRHVALGAIVAPVPAALLLCETYGEQQEQQQINTKQWTTGHASVLWPTTKHTEEAESHV